MGQQHNPLSSIYRFAVLRQNDMFKHRQKRKEKGGVCVSVSPQCGASYCTELGKDIAMFVSLQKHFLKKTCGKGNWTGCSLLEYTRP